MKKLKILCFLCSVIMCCGILASCSGGLFGGGEKLQADTLYVANFQGGLGRKWLDEAIAEYKKINNEAKIEIIEKQMEFNDANLINNMSSYAYDLYFLSDMTYSKYVQNGLFADMTDIVTEKIYDSELNLTTENPTVSIIDSMVEDFKDVYGLKNEADETRYYAIPFYQSPYGFTYDVDLFEKEGFYLQKDGSFGGTENKTVGRDGIEGTFDDGLPATMTEFDALCSELVSASVIPFMWAGTTNYQRVHTFEALHAQYSGKSDFMLNYNFNGTDSVLGEINSVNAYNLQKQTGKKAATAFIKYVIDGGENTFYYTSDVLSHTEAQETYLSSVKSNDMNQVAMLLEGGYWECESRENNFFTNVSSLYKDDSLAYGARKFGYMPIPQFDAEFCKKVGIETPSVNEYNMFMFGSQSLVAISANSQKQDMAAEFLRFVQSKQGLNIFTKNTGSVRAFNYDLTEDTKSALTNYSLTVWDAFTSEKLVKIYDLKNHTFFDNFRDDFNHWSCTGSYENVNSRTSLGDPFGAFRKNKNLTVEQWFNGCSNYWTEAKWQTYVDFILD